jgi:hypothetical protein
VRQALLLAAVCLAAWAGCKDDAPSTGGAPAVLNFGPGIGSQWTYRYSYTQGPHPPLPGLLEERSGRRLWELQSRMIYFDSVTSTIAVSALDTVRQREYSGGLLIRDTSFIQSANTLFSVVVTADSIRTTVLSTMRIPDAVPPSLSRALPAAGDTVKVNGTRYDYAFAWYVQNVGLVRYAAGHTSPQSSLAEELVLSSFSLR